MCYRFIKDCFETKIDFEKQRWPGGLKRFILEFQFAI